MEYAQVGWDSQKQQYARFAIVSKYVNTGDIVIDIGAGVGTLNDYLLQQGKRVNYVPVEPSPTLFPKLFAKYPNAIYASLFSPNLRSLLTPYLPAKLVCALGVIAELQFSRLGISMEEKERLFIQKLLGIPAKYIIFDIWDVNFFKRRGVDDKSVHVCDPGVILNLVEEYSSKNWSIHYFRMPRIDPEASFFVINCE